MALMSWEPAAVFRRREPKTVTRGRAPRCFGRAPEARARASARPIRKEREMAICVQRELAREEKDPRGREGGREE